VNKNRRAATLREMRKRMLGMEHVGQDTPLPRQFDEVTDEEIAAISAEIGATGARRPASE
jgi:hypothetical protein